MLKSGDLKDLSFLLALSDGLERADLGLAPSDFNGTINLEPTYGKGQIKVLRYESHAPSLERVFAALIWEASFGTHFKIWHWYILFNLLCKGSSLNNTKVGLFLLLRVVTAKRDLAFFSSMKCLYSILKDSFPDPEVSKSILTRFLNMFPIKIPPKDPRLHTLLSCRELTISLTKAPDVTRIGVGYKDKGSIGSPGLEPLGTNPEYIRLIDWWETLVSQTIQQFPEMDHLFNTKGRMVNSNTSSPSALTLGVLMSLVEEAKRGKFRYMAI